MSKDRVYIAAVSKKHFISVFILLMGCSLSLHSQDTDPSLSDRETADSTLICPSHVSHYFVSRCILGKPYSSPIDFSGTLQLPDMTDYDTYLRVMESVSRNVRQDSTQDLPLAAKVMLVMVQLVCKSPGDCPEGYVRMSQTSGPLRNIYMKIPGHAPEVTPLSQENAPTCVKLEYDSSSGRYREELVEWDAVRK